ncbi:MAG: flagellum-specific ATP synthase FliI, partial [Lachnospiraceae bacterium]|nr:flagellum-specific ATP synthase FliI [Lachnospiraceae bacterium]
MAQVSLDKYYKLLDLRFTRSYGKVTKLVGLTIESLGPVASLNDLCIIYSKDRQTKIYAEVVGFRDDVNLLMPYGNVEGISVGSLVESTGAPFRVSVGKDILGKTLDGLGRP